MTRSTLFILGALLTVFLACTPRTDPDLIEYTGLCADGLDNDEDGLTDCDDDDCIRHPRCSEDISPSPTGPVEICDDLFDNDGDGLTDCDDDDCDDAFWCVETCADGLDNDGNGLTDCEDPDCLGHPSCPELCDDLLDNDGDGAVDCFDVDCVFTIECNPGCADDDGDGYWLDLGGCGLGGPWDCDDQDADAYPGAVEIACDGVDNDCDGSDHFDDVDDDGDGFSDCDQDCDDTDPDNFPGNTELCDAADNNCNGLIDEGLSFDADGDGATSTASCSGSADDCDDNDATVYPGAWDECGGPDSDCSGVDGDNPPDLDGDGVFPVGSCGLPNGDCDDGDGNVYPGAPEQCDGKDNNCDGLIDEGLDPDADGDGLPAIGSCGPGPYDCDDSDAAVPPGCPFDMTGDFPTMGNGPARTGYFPGYVGNATLSAGWSLNVAREQRQPAIADGLVYMTLDPATADDSLVVAYDENTGSERWRVSVPYISALLTTPPTFYGGAVYVQNLPHQRDGSVMSLNAATGASRWSFTTRTLGYTLLSPLVDGINVYGISDEGQFFASWNINNGSPGFEVSIADEWDYTAATDGARLYIFNDGHLRALNPGTGATDWTFDVQASVWPTRVWGAAPVVADGRVYAHDTEDRFYALNAADGSVAWVGTGTDFNSSPAVANGVVYVVDSGDTVLSFDAATGAELDTFRCIGTQTLYQPIVTDDALITGGSTATCVFDLTTGVEIDRVNSGGMMSVANGRLYIANTTNALETFVWSGG